MANGYQILREMKVSRTLLLKAFDTHSRNSTEDMPMLAFQRSCKTRLDMYKDSRSCLPLHEVTFSHYFVYEKQFSELQDDQADALTEGQAVERSVNDDMQSSVGDCIGRGRQVYSGGVSAVER